MLGAEAAVPESAAAVEPEHPVQLQRRVGRAVLLDTAPDARVTALRSRRPRRGQGAAPHASTGSSVSRRLGRAVLRPRGEAGGSGSGSRAVKQRLLSSVKERLLSAVKSGFFHLVHFENDEGRL